ncbi:MAG: ion transporter, partial [Flavobacteriales bacterium]|nr:ion transporter [Flavobacteriales bacterium]
MKPWRSSLHEIIFEADTKAGKAFDVVLLWLIVLSVFTVLLESVPELHEQYRKLFFYAEWTFTGLFTIEYVLRLLVVRKPLHYMTSFFGLVDLIAILPSFIGILIPGSGSLRVIRILRLLRMFRVL